jgi:hypothetical protein
MPAFDPPSRGIVDENVMAAFNPPVQITFADGFRPGKKCLWAD